METKLAYQPSIICRNLDDGRITYERWPNVLRPAASLANLYASSAIIAMSEEGIIDLGQPVQISWQEFFQRADDTGRLYWRFLPFAWFSKLSHHQLILALSLEKLIYYAIHHSDNLALLKLTTEVDNSHIQSMLDRWGMHQTTINQTTASDVAHFLVQLDNRKLIKNPWPDRIQDWLQRRNILGLEVLYQDGASSDQNFSYRHRAGYVFHEETGQAFVVMTQAQLPSSGKPNLDQRLTIEDLTNQVARHAIL